mgnify:FL=1
MWLSLGQNMRWGLAGGLLAGGMALGMPSRVVDASAACVQPTEYSWEHSGWLKSFDYASVRRGFQVYREVCSSCHSINRIAFRNLVGVVMTEEEAKELAAEYDVQDGPNEEGEMFTRPGKLSDLIPGPYPNAEAARAANNKALPPDLSLIIKARPRREDYVFALLTGYQEPPEGIEIRDGQYYNPYFDGGAISMAPPLADEALEFEDGTPATMSQMAKDVVTFLSWAAEPEHDDRKKMGMKWVFALTVAAAGCYYMKRFRWNLLKNRRLEYWR